jgi:hypothetical protein
MPERRRFTPPWSIEERTASSQPDGDKPNGHNEADDQ